MIYIDNYENKIKYYIDTMATKFLNIPTVIGLGLSLKEINGHSTTTPSLTFFVKEKLSPYELNPQYIIPKTIGPIITDIIETGDFYANASGKKSKDISPFYNQLSDDDGLSRIDKYRPAFGGLSCSNENLPKNGEGCISAAVTFSNPIERPPLLFLSCNHVLSRDFVGNVRDPIEQPAKIYRNSHRLASAHFIKSMSPRTTNPTSKPTSLEWNQYNCALAFVGYLDDLHKQTFLRPGLGMNKNDYIPINGTDTPKINDEIWKIGPYPTLTKTKGKVTATNVALINIDIRDKAFAFKDQCLAKIPFNRGDAGALLMKTTGITKKDIAIGMCFASGTTKGFTSGITKNEELTVFTPINFVLEALKIKFIN